jgi:hypothetical protein
MYCTDLPPISLGSRANVFFSGMPSEAAGPVAETVTPTLIWADAAPVNAANASASTVGSCTAKPTFEWAPVNLFFMLLSPFMFKVLVRQGLRRPCFHHCWVLFTVLCLAPRACGKVNAAMVAATCGPGRKACWTIASTRIDLAF